MRERPNWEHKDELYKRDAPCNLAFAFSQQLLVSIVLYTAPRLFSLPMDFGEKEGIIPVSNKCSFKCWFPTYENLKQIHLSVPQVLNQLYSNDKNTHLIALQ